jgi:predicted glycoside hydrolase/deacetylase ChbG (UPF0249 family)
MFGSPDHIADYEFRSGTAPANGILIINADDWGRNHETTDRIFDCASRGAVSSVSAMVFMDDSERAATIARERDIDTGLHLNLTDSLTASGSPTRLIEHQQRLCRYLRRHRLAQALFHPGLVSSFKYVVAAQLDEFTRLYGAGPNRVDGHHHMHLCANVLFQNLLPSGTIVRRNFSFQPGEKTFGNLFYRRVMDRKLSRRHRLTDFFFSLTPLKPESRLQQMFSLARQFVVEIETHPVNPEEHRFLMGGEIFQFTVNCGIAPRFTVPQSARIHNHSGRLGNL